MSTPSKIKQFLSAQNLAPSKKFGQNFLVNKNTPYKIISFGEIKNTDTVIEVGVGLGALTLPLAETAFHVIGIEIDSGIIRYHQQNKTLPDNVTLVHQDILQTDFSALYEQVGSKLKIMANLPYSISNPFIFKLIENRHLLLRATIMLQKEVADRLMAHPGSKAYGIPTVLLQSCASIKKLMTIQPDQFYPRPKVDSVVVQISFSPKPFHLKNIEPYNYSILRTIVRAAFGQRRKTLYNTLSSSRLLSTSNLDKNEIRSATKEAIINCDISPEIRGETLNLQQFVSLAISFEKTLSQLEKSRFE